MLSLTEENYVKAIYHLSESGEKVVLTNEIAETTNTKAASVTDMIKKLSAKNLVAYEKYYGVQLTSKGKAEALLIIRKHRLWETFLVQSLGFAWDEVHDVAEQLEHIQSALLIEKLDSFLGYPKMDPHGEPIPDHKGKFKMQPHRSLDQQHVGYHGVIITVKDSDASLLKYLEKIGALPGKKLKLISRQEFDNSMEIEINKNKFSISREVSKNILVTL
ncbi:MAG TPA: metal-dependent transcriptional regulator [Cyclobacteriaceae bacterium]|jgi:DtxR family Mn-dependent transcriptional regulator|nr:metal-dependent transcriptional regulator [Cyclobacteriaceae bacterium]